MSDRLEEKINNLPYSIRHEGNVERLIDYAIAQQKRVEELEEQRNERTHLLNAEVARNVRYKKVLDELWKMAKRALEESE